MNGSRFNLLLGLLAMTLCGAVAIRAKAHDLPGDYFPEGTVDSWDTKNWFGKYLSRMDEPSLAKMPRYDRAIQVYRVSYFPAYSDYVALRLEVRSGGTGLLELRKMEQVEVNGGYEPGRMTRKGRFIISKRSVDRFLALLGQIDFWQLPVERQLQGLGGTMYLYEGVRHGAYYVVEVPEPGHEGLDSPGRYLMKMVGE
jgi:hypothetical protein